MALALNKSSLKQQRDQLVQQSQWSRYQVFMSEWFDPDNIVARAGFVPAANVEP